MEVPLLDLRAQYRAIRPKICGAIEEVLESQQFILGPQVSALESEIAALCGVPHAVGVASGTDALMLSLKAVGVGPGDSVVTVPYTFYATAGAIVNLGARPLFVDIDEASFNMDPERLTRLLERECIYHLSSQKLVHRTTGTAVKALVPVHLFGQCAEMDDILEIGRRYRLPVVEDACQAIGAQYRDKAAGALGDAGCFSFFPSKNLGGAGDGGMVITSSQELAERVRVLRIHGTRPKYYHAIAGFNSRLDELQAAILRVKLPYLGQWTEARQRNASEYRDAFQKAGLLSKVVPAAILPGRTHVFHQYVVRCRQRDELQAFLETRRIGTAIYYPVPLHEQECFQHLGYTPPDFPRSHQASQETLALPIYPELTTDQKTFVVSSIAEFYRHV